MRYYSAFLGKILETCVSELSGYPQNVTLEKKNVHFISGLLPYEILFQSKFENFEKAKSSFNELKKT